MARMLNIKLINSYANVIERDVLHYRFESCGRNLKVNQVLRKKFDNKGESIVSIYYWKTQNLRK